MFEEPDKFSGESVVRDGDSGVIYIDRGRHELGFSPEIDASLSSSDSEIAFTCKSPDVNEQDHFKFDSDYLAKITNS
ncbi:hypothetical protein NEOLI_004471 [Neolecta irregularis DAH-3]|uniref:Uncharacterized protein n=1 Tax=Neolecta irregularis (strain DAH-3) TaxID=1198029 RepID=A0A1U7LKR6_NEOID|nr:hypothetical protein NEOLI_004471 [Neolecta irregularis DAH-3]|eukprot:OLL23250.1 hypothetical protein NEOLI_004471 [Neolecta irregularis DAH-3]